MTDPIDLSLLETFVEVARRRSVALAAKALHRSQPAISHRLRALEAELELVLFERVGRRLQLSPHGAALLERAEEVLALARELRQSPGGHAPSAGSVTVAILPALAAHLVAPEAARAMAKHPSMQLNFRFGLGPAVVESVRRGEADLGLYAGAIHAQGVEAEQVGRIDLALALAPGKTARGAVPPHRLRELRYLAWSGLEDPTMDIVARYVQRHRLMNEHTPRVPHIETLRELVACGGGYTLLPSYTLRRDEALGRLVVRRARGLRETVPLICVRRKRAVATPLVELVRRSIVASARHACLPR